MAEIRGQGGTYSLKEAAERAAVGVRVMKRAAEQGQVPAIKIGRRWRIPKIAFDRLLANGKS
jgi:excisionase family DNA binding protein